MSENCNIRPRPVEMGVRRVGIISLVVDLSVAAQALDVVARVGPASPGLGQEPT